MTPRNELLPSGGYASKGARAAGSSGTDGSGADQDDAVGAGVLERRERAPPGRGIADEREIAERRVQEGGLGSALDAALADRGPDGA